MNAMSKITLAAAGLVMAGQAAAQITFYEREGFEGRSFTTQGQVRNFESAGFNDRASSVVVARSERWEVCEDVRFRGRCVVLRQGQYPSLAAMGLNDRVSSVRAVSRDAPIDDDRYAPMPPPVQVSQVMLFEHEGFQGRTFTTETEIRNLNRNGFNDRASSAVVRGERWEVCEDARYRGRCVVLRRGQYPSLAAMGLNDRVSSVRALSANVRIDEDRFGPPPVAAYDYGRRPSERLYQADITSVRAVVNAPTQRCWVEREQVVPEQRSSANVPGAIVGAVIGGILGHQVGGGSGRNVATAVGVVGGAAIGGNVNRENGGQQVVTQDVQRCTSVPSQAAPEYWDVTYNFRDIEHRVQMTTHPGASVTVNEQGEPRA
jgi:uncharacterized protein YcfJ